MWTSLAFADLAGDYAGALVHARRSLEIGRTRTPHEHLHGTTAVMWCAYHLGDWATVRELLDEHLATLAPMEPACCPYLRAGPMVGALALAHGGDLDRAREVADRIEPDLAQPGLPESLLARVLVATGQPAEGERLARSMVDGGRRPSLEENDHETHALIEALLAQEDWGALRQLLPAARRRARALSILGPVCDRAEAMALVADGAPERAVPLLRRSADRFARSRVPFELARTMTLLAPLVPDGDRVLAEAIETAEPLLGARLDEVSATARPVTVRRAVPSRTGDPGPRRGWPREPRHRRRAGPEPADRGAPCVEHLPEARSGGTDRTRRRGGVGAPARGRQRSPLTPLRVGRHVRPDRRMCGLRPGTDGGGRAHPYGRS